MSTKSENRQDVYTRVTDKIIADLERGVRTWMKPWNAEHATGRITRPLRHNGQPYNGINVLMLWSAALENGYSAPIWMTYKQAVELGAHVRKGEKGELVVYANTITRTEQIEELPAHYYQLEAPVLDPVQRIERAEAFFAATKADIRHGGNQAFYAIASDRTQLPPFESFCDVESYYATLAHEMTHNAGFRIMPR